MQQARFLELLHRKPHFIDVCRLLVDGPLDTVQLAKRCSFSRRSLLLHLRDAWLHGLLTRSGGSSLGATGRMAFTWNLTEDGRFLAEAQVVLRTEEAYHHA
jgi:hypothetical protein